MNDASDLRVSQQPSRNTAVLLEWPSPPSTAALSDDDVHVWRIDLDMTPVVLEFCRACLADDERERASRFLAPLHQARYIAARGALRGILGRYLTCPPVSVRFAYGSRGKPFLPDTAIRFNVSHSGGRALCAVTLHREIGVDLEQVRQNRPLMRLADRFFSEAESAMLRRLPAEEQAAAFFQLWTLKEAYIKACGEGLAISLNQFEIQWNGESPEAALRVAGNPRETARWRLITLDAEMEFAAALAVEGQGWNLVRWTYTA